MFSESNLSPPASAPSARNLSVSVKQQASQTNFMVPSGDGYRQQGSSEEDWKLFESADMTLVFGPNCHFSDKSACWQTIKGPTSLHDAAVEVECWAS